MGPILYDSRVKSLCCPSTLTLAFRPSERARYPAWTSVSLQPHWRRLDAYISGQTPLRDIPRHEGESSCVPGGR
jgi:hypothetical protein